MSGETRACQLVYNFFNLVQKVSASSFTASAMLYRRPAGMLRAARAGSVRLQGCASRRQCWRGLCLF